MPFGGHERHVHLVGRDLDGLSEVEARTRRIGGDGGAALTEHDLLVRHAASLGAEDEGDVALHFVEPGDGTLGGGA